MNLYVDGCFKGQLPYDGATIGGLDFYSYYGNGFKALPLLWMTCPSCPVARLWPVHLEVALWKRPAIMTPLQNGTMEAVVIATG